MELERMDGWHMIIFFWFDDPPEAIYLLYFDQILEVYQKHNWGFYSLQLDKSKLGLLKTVFDDNNIPHKTDADPYEPQENNKLEDDGQAHNSRVVFTYGEDDYTVYLPECRMMKNQMAEKLNIALNRKGIKSRVEILGSHRGAR